LDEPKTDLELNREKRGSTTTESGEDDAAMLLPGSVPGTPLRRTGTPRRDRSPSKAASMREDQLRVVSLFTGSSEIGGGGHDDDDGAEARTLSPGRSGSSRFTSPGRSSSRRSPERSPVRHPLLPVHIFRAFLTRVFVGCLCESTASKVDGIDPE
jgi:hypothetical protein